MYTNVTVGCDSEIFGFDPVKNEVVSLVGLIGGTKKDPLPVELGTIQEDNVAAEIGIFPAKLKEEFSFNINHVVQQLEAKVKSLGLELKLLSSAELRDEYLISKQARTFGCEPDFNAWELSENPPPQCENKNLRSCGGHIHVGWDNPQNKDRVMLIRAMDIFLGLPSVIMDDDSRRRLLYGKAGAMRFKPYGVEYRTLSNFWMKDKSSMEWAFEQTQKAIHYVPNNLHFLEEDDLHIDIQRAINTGDKKLSEDLMKWLLN